MLVVRRDEAAELVVPIRAGAARAIVPVELRRRKVDTMLKGTDEASPDLSYEHIRRSRSELPSEK